MRFALATVALFAASASSVLRRQNFPDCASTCIANADTGSCGGTDYACICGNQTIISTIIGCFQSSCSGADLTNAVQAGQAICAAAGVTLSNLPTGSATAAPTTAANSTASGSVSVSTSVSIVSSVSRSVSSSAAAPVSTATIPATSSASKPAATSNPGSGATTVTSSGSAAPASSSTSGGSIIGISALAGLAAFGLAALTL